MNGRRRPRFTLLVLADVVAIAATIAAVAIVAGRLSQRSEAAPTPPPAPAAVAEQEDVPQVGDPPPASRRKLPPADDCRRKGITAGKEGDCFSESGRHLEVVNRGSVLRLPEMEARLHGVETKQRRVESAADIRFRLTLTSRLDGAVDLVPERFGLHIGDRLFTPDPVLNSFAKDALGNSGKTLRRGDQVTGSVVFRVPAHYGARIGRDAELWIAQFTDFSPKTAGRTIGVIRTAQ